MTGEHADRPGRPRLVLDSGVYVSAAISGAAAPAQLPGAAIEGRERSIVDWLSVDDGVDLEPGRLDLQLEAPEL